MKMLKQFFCVLSLCLVCANAHSASVASAVTDVTLYSSGATVTRTASVNLNAGDQKLELTGFPVNIQPDELQVEVSGKNVIVGQVNLKEIKFRDAQNPELAKLTQEIDRLEREMALIKDSSKSANLQLKFLDSLATGYAKEAWVGSAQASADTASWQRALTLMQSGSSNAYKILRDNDRKLAELNKDLSLLKRKLNDVRGDERATNTVIVSLNAQNVGKQTIRVHYQQYQANWSPSYEARLNTSTGRLALAQKAVIQQNTQEDWVNAKVTLSTSQPSENITAPQVSSVFYDLYKPQPYAPRLRSAKVAQDSYSASASLEDSVVTAAKTAPAWSGTYALNFPIAGRISVSNDYDEVQRYDLRKYNFDTELITQIVPRQSTDAYLAARFKHTGDIPLYASGMTIYVDGVLMGEATMPSILPGAEVTLPMGQDRQIEVTVSDLGGQASEGGIIKKQRSKVENLVFEITNRRSAPGTIEVRDYYPISKNKALKVVVGKDATPPTIRDEDDKKGVMVWRKVVDANSEWKINYKVTMTYPADQTLRQAY